MEVVSNHLQVGGGNLMYYNQLMEFPNRQHMDWKVSDDVLPSSDPQRNMD